MPATATERQRFAAELQRLIDDERVMTRADLARHCGVTPTTVGYWISGKKAPHDRPTAELIDASLNAHGAILSALGYADVTDWRAEVEQRLTRIEAALNLESPPPPPPPTQDA